MQTICCVVKTPYAYLVPIGDTHIGDKNCDMDLLIRNIEWVKNTPQARVFLMGDIINTATRVSKSNPFQQIYGTDDQIEVAYKIFSPIQKQIIGGIQGNHEQRLTDFAGYSPTLALCSKLKIPYGGVSTVILLKVGVIKRTRYFIYAHHTTGGGSTVGGKINRVDALRRLMSNADIYLGGHNHMLGVVPVVTNEIDRGHEFVVRELRQVIVDCGSYVKWQEGYAESKMYPPVKLGSPRIRLDGKHRDVHVSV